MAAICYQPYRSHLAQPARCLDSESREDASLTLRRRQLLQQCAERGAGRGGTREDVARSAVVQSTPVSRRLNIESGWSKVEEVRKKFEGAAASSSYSRSFESPPRRRLADSLFASFKLPRREMAAGAGGGAPARRKTAVQLLQESKAFYVKSETVRDSKQEMPLRVSSGLSQAIAAGGCHLVSSGTINNDCCNPYAGRAAAAARRQSELQSTLRRLLEHNDNRDIYAAVHKAEPLPLSGTSSSSGSKPGRDRPDKPDRPDKSRPRSLDARMFLPDSFVGRTRGISTAFSIPSPQSSPESGEELCAEQIGAISPPAQYARYVRSNSHSQASVREESYNINSHKSLPDLHAQATCYIEHVPPSTDTIGRSPRRRRPSNHQRTASCSSKGTRSNHSSLISSCEAFSEHPSPGEETYQYNSRSGSFARDSGGSSGHYTQGSARRHHRTDSDCSNRGVLVVSAPPQFQDGAPPPRDAPPPPPPHCNVGIHFQASAPPPQFQDEPPYDSYYDGGYTPTKCRTTPRKEYAKRDYNRYQDSNPDVITSQPQYQESRRPKVDDTAEYVNASQIQPTEDIKSPLGTFKRQRCLRYKQRRPRPILRSKSDISDRYRRTEGRSPSSAPCDTPDSPDSLSDESEHLSWFFERLGLDSRQYEAVFRANRDVEPVYFSSCSSVDSNQLLPDYTVQGPQKQIYRNTEPPSVVERNARIVKWLCQCRKTMQQTTH